MTDTIPTSRRKRFARRAVVALVGVVLLVGGYIGSVPILYFAVNAGALPIDLPDSWLWNRYVAPYVWYMRCDLPGSEDCRHLIDWACFEGDRMAGN